MMNFVYFGGKLLNTKFLFHFLFNFFELFFVFQVSSLSFFYVQNFFSKVFLHLQFLYILKSSLWICFCTLNFFTFKVFSLSFLYIFIFFTLRVSLCSFFNFLSSTLALCFLCVFVDITKFNFFLSQHCLELLCTTFYFCDFVFTMKPLNLSFFWCNSSMLFYKCRSCWIMCMLKAKLQQLKNWWETIGNLRAKIWCSMH